MSFLCIGIGSAASHKRRRSVGSAEKPIFARSLSRKSPRKPARSSCTSLDSGITLPVSPPSNGGSLPKIIVVQDFKAVTNSELSVRKGQMVKALQQKTGSEWIYVESSSGDRGYVPAGICVTVVIWSSDDDSDGSPPATPASCRSTARISRAFMHTMYTCELTVTVRSRASDDSGDQQAAAFDRRPQGFALALYPFRGRMEDDLPIQRGDWLVVLNSRDRSWIWVRRKDGREGFVPCSYVSRLDGRPRPARKPQLKHYSSDGDLIGLAPMMVEWSYHAVHSSAVTISRGELVYADLTSRTTHGWLWVHVPTRNCHGFVPATFIRPLTSSV